MTGDEFAQLTAANPLQMRDLKHFQAELALWNERLNLVGPSATASFWDRHVLDSSQLLHVEQSALTWLDVGAGAGFPGIVLAILLKSRRGACVHLVESIGKRVHFLERLAAGLSLPVVIHHARAEKTPSPAGLELVTARACAPFPRLFGYTQHFFKAGARGLFLKGRGVESELTEARQSWTFQSEMIQSRSDPSGRMVSIKGLAPRAE